MLGYVRHRARPPPWGGSREGRRRAIATTTTATSLPPPSWPPTELLEAAARSWAARATPVMGERLLRDGYHVLRGAFPRELTRRLRDEMDFLRASEQMYPNATHVLLHGAPEPLLLEKHSIVETELALPEIRAQVPTLQWFFDHEPVLRAARAVLPEWLGIAGHMIKLQHNAGHGGCFPMHFDSYGDDGKCLTAVLYLNDAWAPGDGGEIVLYPFPRGRRVVVEPRDGDLVFFASEQMLHRVMPSRRPRDCLTTWIYRDPQRPHDANASAAREAFYSVAQRDNATATAGRTHVLAVLDKIMRSPFRRHLAKIAHRDEWTQSLLESHRQTDAFDRYMATQRRELEVIDAATTEMLAKFRRKDPMQPSTLPSTAAELVEFLDREEYRDHLATIPIRWF